MYLMHLKTKISKKYILETAWGQGVGKKDTSFKNNPFPFFPVYLGIRTKKGGFLPALFLSLSLPPLPTLPTLPNYLHITPNALEWRISPLGLGARSRTSTIRSDG